MGLEENFTRNENLPTDPQITFKTLFYIALYWIGVFLLSIFLEDFNEFISLLVRERIFCQALVSKPTAQTISQQVQKPI